MSRSSTRVSNSNFLNFFAIRLHFCYLLVKKDKPCCPDNCIHEPKLCAICIEKLLNLETKCFSVIGFFVLFEDDSIKSARIVKQWNVKIVSVSKAFITMLIIIFFYYIDNVYLVFVMQISKNERHQYRAAALEVWSWLEESMRSRSLT